MPALPERIQRFSESPSMPDRKAGNFATSPEGVFPNVPAAQARPAAGEIQVVEWVPSGVPLPHAMVGLRRAEHGTAGRRSWSRCFTR